MSEYRQEEKGKVKRDLLATSVILIFVSQAGVDIGQFSIFGVSGSVHTPEVAYGLLICIWFYFIYRHLVLNWSGFSSLRDRRNDLMMKEAETLAFADAYLSDVPNIQEDRVSCYFESVDGESQYVCKVPYQTALGKNAEYETKFGPDIVKGWERRINARQDLRHEYVLEAWVPIIVVVLTIVAQFYKPWAC